MANGNTSTSGSSAGVGIRDMYMENLDGFSKTPHMRKETKETTVSSCVEPVKKRKKRSKTRRMDKVQTSIVQNTSQAVLYEFAEGTTFHGVRYVLQRGYGLGRRFVWFLMFCACAGALTFQIVDRVMYYYDWPVTVNVRVNYNHTLRFPAVTICNQNAFKATVSYDLHRYRLLESMYLSSDTFNLINLDVFDARNITVDQLFLQSAHRKQDFISRCYWKGTKCGAENFRITATDHGICYTFNDKDSDEYISSAGADDGLRLTLNVEQYEYMPGPHDAAGVKMLLHTKGDVPRVHALGQAVPTGTHVFVGVKTVLLRNLPRPYGTCRDRTLTYVDHYSVHGCQMDCLTGLAMERCRCRHFYMLHKNGVPPSCTLYQYYTCLKPLVEEFTTLSESICDCPVPCDIQQFEPDLSYASTSQYAVTKFLSANDTEHLSSNLLAAKEVTSRMENETFQRTQKLAKNLEGALTDIEELLSTNLTEMVKRLLKSMNECYTDMSSLYNTKEFLYRFQIYIVQKNFIRGKDAMEERTIQNVALMYAEFILTIEKRIRRLADRNFTDPSARLMMHIASIILLSNKRTTIEMAYRNYTQLTHAYDNASPIFNYSFENLSRAYNGPATPKHLIILARVHNEYAINHGRLYGVYLKKLINSINSLMNLTDMAYYNSVLDEESVVNARELLHTYMRRFVFARSVFYYETVEWPVRILETRLAQFRNIWQKYSGVVKNIQQSLKSLEISGEQVKTIFLYPMRHVQSKVDHYILSNNETKMSIAELMTSAKISEGIHHFRSHFNSLRSRETILTDLIHQIETDVMNMWQIVVEDTNSEEYYLYTNQSQLLRNFTEIEREIRTNFTAIKHLCHFAQIVANKDAAFLQAFEAFLTDARDYQNSIKIDSNFVTENYLQLDIFYRQLSYEEIQQQYGYDIFALLCDVGGSMGLFLGASVLSIFEILDLMLMQAILRPIKCAWGKLKKYLQNMDLF